MAGIFSLVDNKTSIKKQRRATAPVLGLSLSGSILNTLAFFSVHEN